MSLKLIGCDFDQTLCDTIPYWLWGPPVPGAALWIDQWRHAGAKVYLHTTRFGPFRLIAAKWCRDNGVLLDAYDDPWWWVFGSKPPYGLIVDNIDEGCPLIMGQNGNMIADFEKIGPDVLAWIKGIRTLAPPYLQLSEKQ